MRNETTLELEPLLRQLHQGLSRHLEQHQRKPYRLIGIRTGGIWIAQELASRLGHNEPLGELDISFHRDDFAKHGLDPQVRPSVLPFAIDNEHLVLVDDVLFTGRTIRAAMNELHDWGRPASISLAVLVSRQGRELPINTPIIGTHLDLPASTRLQLEGPSPLVLRQLDETR